MPGRRAWRAAGAAAWLLIAGVLLLGVLDPRAGESPCDPSTWRDTLAYGAVTAAFTASLLAAWSPLRDRALPLAWLGVGLVALGWMTSRDAATSSCLVLRDDTQPSMTRRVVFGIACAATVLHVRAPAPTTRERFVICI